MSKNFICLTTPLVILCAIAGGCEGDSDPCDSESEDYSPIGCLFSEDKRPVCTGEEWPWEDDCRKEAYTARELGLSLGMEAEETGALLEREGYLPESEGGQYQSDSQALESLAMLAE